MGKSKAKSQADIDWENRTLCNDESCIGVIGPDGHCKECGKILEGYNKNESRQAQSGPQADTISGEEDTLNEKEEIFPQTDNDTTLKADIDWKNRTLCSDESCIGVIGPDGHCKECGKIFK